MSYERAVSLAKQRAAANGTTYAAELGKLLQSHPAAYDDYLAKRARFGAYALATLAGEPGAPQGGAAACC